MMPKFVTFVVFVARAPMGGKRRHIYTFQYIVIGDNMKKSTNINIENKYMLYKHGKAKKC